MYPIQASSAAQPTRSSSVTAVQAGGQGQGALGLRSDASRQQRQCGEFGHGQILSQAPA